MSTRKNFLVFIISKERGFRYGLIFFSQLLYLFFVQINLEKLFYVFLLANMDSHDELKIT